jgi:hypothetical protein
MEELVEPFQIARREINSLLPGKEKIVEEEAQR